MLEKMAVAGVSNIVYRTENINEGNTSRNCYLCSGKPTGTWRLVGYDEYGELWICQLCWDQLPPDDSSSGEMGIEEQHGSLIPLEQEIICPEEQ